MRRSNVCLVVQISCALIWCISAVFLCASRARRRLQAKCGTEKCARRARLLGCEYKVHVHVHDNRHGSRAIHTMPVRRVGWPGLSARACRDSRHAQNTISCRVHSLLRECGHRRAEQRRLEARVATSVETALVASTFEARRENERADTRACMHRPLRRDGQRPCESHAAVGTPSRERPDTRESNRAPSPSHTNIGRLSCRRG